MHILMITENDPAGMGIGFTNAINRYTEHTCRLITMTDKYGFFYEKDIHVPDIESDDFTEVEQLLKDTDIIHFHILRDENTHLGPLAIRNYLKGKKILHHHHGHPHFRANPGYYREKYKRLKRKVLVSTPDLLKLVPEASWLPNLVPLNDPLLKPQPCKVNGKVLIGQAPTRKEIKNTKELVAVVAELHRRKTSPAPELKIIERLPYKQCLAEKNKCHIIFDHMQGYYGVSSLESLSQGKPVIAGLDAWNEFYIKEFTGCEEIPWVLGRNAIELEARLKALLSRSEIMDFIGQRSRTFMEKHWSEQHVLEVLLRTYESL